MIGSKQVLRLDNFAKQNTKYILSKNIKADRDIVVSNESVSFFYFEERDNIFVLYRFLSYLIHFTSL